MGKLAGCMYDGRGVAEDPRQAAIWFQKAADLGDGASRATLGAFLVNGDARAGVAKDAARGFEMVRQAVAQGQDQALHAVAQCYVKGEGVAKDAVHGVALFRQVRRLHPSTTQLNLSPFCHRQSKAN
jgi:hypothetical protein